MRAPSRAVIERIVPIVGAFLLLATALLFPAPARAQADFGTLRVLLHDLRRPSDGALDWGAVAEKHTDGLERLLRQLDDPYAPEQWKALSFDEQKAFWMNAHLAIVVWQVERNYPIQGGRIRFFPESSVQQIEKFWESEYPVMGHAESLATIEKKLGEEYGDPKCLLALFLGGRGGPPAPRQPWRAKYLSRDVEETLKAYFWGESAPRVDASERVLWLPQPLSNFRREAVLRASRAAEKGVVQTMESSPSGPWKEYSEDEGRLLAFLEPYLPYPTVQRLKARRHELREIPFDWRLADATAAQETPQGIPLEPPPLEGGKFNVMPEPPEQHLPRKPKKDLQPGEIKPIFEGGEDGEKDKKK